MRSPRHRQHHNHNMVAEVVVNYTNYLGSWRRVSGRAVVVVGDPFGALLRNALLMYDSELS